MKKLPIYLSLIKTVFELIWLNLGLSICYKILSNRNCVMPNKISKRPLRRKTSGDGLIRLETLGHCRKNHRCTPPPLIQS